jgi:hypothetical protein
MRMTYPWGDFVADYNAWPMRVQEAEKSQIPSNVDWERRHFELAADAFRERYADERQRRDRMMRFGWIITHVSARALDSGIKENGSPFQGSRSPLVNGARLRLTSLS